MDLQFTADVIEWRGPAPYYYAVVPTDEADLIAEVAQSIIYWGCVPAVATIGPHTYRTAMFPKEGTYRVPIRKQVRDDLGIEAGDVIEVELFLDV
ncbi:DUF1905 domain-containing protein [Aestuariimicrobium soli]|uniref:DUF1905 domain-containing protein n=1 Tax=Aestuariimicrobium soli TaxID=2035834 RepID=UPI003EBCE307